MPVNIYILTVRENNEMGKLICNLSVCSNLRTAISFVITQKNNHQSKYLLGGILKYQTADALDAYVMQDFGDHVYLYGNDFYKVTAEKSVFY